LARILGLGVGKLSSSIGEPGAGAGAGAGVGALGVATFTTFFFLGSGTFLALGLGGFGIAGIESSFFRYALFDAGDICANIAGSIYCNAQNK